MTLPSPQRPQPLLNVLWKLFDRLNVINGLTYHLFWQLRAFQAMAQERLNAMDPAKANSQVPALWGGTSLPVSDLTQPDEWAVLYASGGFRSSNEEYLRIADSLMRRNAAWAVAQGWEAHETFLFDILATYLEANTALASPAKLSTYSKKHADQAPSKPAEWAEFARLYRSGNNKDLLDLLRQLAPHFKDGEVKNWRSLDLRAWYRALARVRHAVTHTDLVLPPDELAAIKSEDVLEYFPGIERDGAYELRLSVESAEKILSLLAEHGFLVFKGLSIAANYDWEVLGKPRPITWSRITG